MSAGTFRCAACASIANVVGSRIARVLGLRGRVCAKCAKPMNLPPPRKS